MFKQLLSDNRIFGALVCVIVFVAGGLLYLNAVKRQAAQEPIKIYKPVAVETKPKPPPPGASANGHWHGDEWHDAPHEPQETAPAAPVVVTPAASAPRVKPFSNFTPDPNDDPVDAAYKRLEYIKNNPNEWGDFSPEALELMDEMTPMLPMEGEGENIIGYLEELSALRDPRSAEILLKYQLESGVSGRPVSDALVVMGPAVVPALIVRLEDLSSDSSLLRPMNLLDLIIAEHRSELGGIVEHIIIPKLEAIAKSNSPYSNAARHRVAELQQ